MVPNGSLGWTSGIIPTGAKLRPSQDRPECDNYGLSNWYETLKLIESESTLERFQRLRLVVTLKPRTTGIILELFQLWFYWTIHTQRLQLGQYGYQTNTLFHFPSNNNCCLAANETITTRFEFIPRRVTCILHCILCSALSSHPRITLTQMLTDLLQIIFVEIKGRFPNCI